jgi:exosortase A-associated hydrolase 2
MTTPKLVADFQPFTSGRLFCLKTSYEQSDCRHVVLLIPPFAEEMNKSRKMMSLLLSKVVSDTTSGYLFDLFGTGDSEGEFAEASWETWQANLISMFEFVAAHDAVKTVSVVALRTGALLFNSTLAELANVPLAHKLSSIHYWNPVFNPSLFIGQFLRLKLAANMMRGDGPKQSVKELRQQLLEDGELEVAGYTLNNKLIESMEEATINIPMRFADIPLHFYELSALSQITPGLAKKISEVSTNEQLCSRYVVDGPQFWSTQEIAISEPLLALTQNNLFSA